MHSRLLPSSCCLSCAAVPGKHHGAVATRECRGRSEAPVTMLSETGNAGSATINIVNKMGSRNGIIISRGIKGEHVGPGEAL